MKWLIYHVASITVEILCVVMLPQYICITSLSLVPVAMILLTILQVCLFKDSQQEEGFSTAYGSDLNAQEQRTWTQDMRFFLMLSLPWQFAFVMFFHSPVKLLSCLWYLAFFVAGSIAFRVKHGKQIGKCQQTQRDELEEQRKREELGKWK